MRGLVRPMWAILRVPEGSEETFPEFWAAVRSGELSWFSSRRIRAMLGEGHPDAYIPVMDAELFMDHACEVAGWDLLDGDPRPIDFIPPDRAWDEKFGG